jgi:hypothetical protein
MRTFSISASAAFSVFFIASLLRTTLVLARTPPQRRQDTCNGLNCLSDVDDSDCYFDSLQPLWTSDTDLSAQQSVACSTYASCLASLSPSSALSYFGAVSLVEDCKLTPPANAGLREYGRNLSDSGPMLELQVPDLVEEEEAPGVDDAVWDKVCEDYSCEGDCNDACCESSSSSLLLQFNVWLTPFGSQSTRHSAFQLPTSTQPAPRTPNAWTRPAPPVKH